MFSFNVIFSIQYNMWHGAFPVFGDTKHTFFLFCFHNEHSCYTSRGIMWALSITFSDYVIMLADGFQLRTDLFYFSNFAGDVGLEYGKRMPVDVILAWGDFRNRLPHINKQFPIRLSWSDTVLFVVTTCLCNNILRICHRGRCVFE